jgi:hypothetical protein
MIRPIVGILAVRKGRIRNLEVTGLEETILDRICFDLTIPAKENWNYPPRAQSKHGDEQRV